MTSEERREGRYLRRKKKRDEKNGGLAKYDNIENVASFANLYKAAIHAMRGVLWKTSTQRYLLQIIKNVAQTRRKLLKGIDVRKGFICFDLIERGKLRHIKSVHFAERVVQKSLCENVLQPVLSRSLIYDNSAAQKGKGTKFALERCKLHLQKHYRKHGTNGYVLQIDFKGYFENIRHEPIFEIIDRYFKDKRLNTVIKSFVSAFGDKSLGLGSEVSQIFAVYYVNAIDHFIKEVLRIKGYGRYMDDLYLIHEDKRYLQLCLARLEVKCRRLGIVLSPKKTKIIKLSKGFTFLKTRFVLTDTGKVYLKTSREAITRVRRKVKKLKRFVDAGEISFDRARAAFESMYGFMRQKDSYKTRCRLASLFYKLFGWRNVKWQN